MFSLKHVYTFESDINIGPHQLDCARSWLQLHDKFSSEKKNCKNNESRFNELRSEYKDWIIRFMQSDSSLKEDIISSINLVLPGHSSNSSTYDEANDDLNIFTKILNGNPSHTFHIESIVKDIENNDVFNITFSPSKNFNIRTNIKSNTLKVKANDLFNMELSANNFKKLSKYLLLHRSNSSTSSSSSSSQALFTDTNIATLVEESVPVSHDNSTAMEKALQMTKNLIISSTPITRINQDILQDNKDNSMVDTTFDTNDSVSYNDVIDLSDIISSDDDDDAHYEDCNSYYCSNDGDYNDSDYNYSSDSEYVPSNCSSSLSDKSTISNQHSNSDSDSDYDSDNDKVKNKLIKSFEMIPTSFMNQKKIEHCGKVFDAESSQTYRNHFYDYKLDKSLQLQSSEGSSSSEDIRVNSKRKCREYNTSSSDSDDSDDDNVFRQKSSICKVPITMPIGYTTQSSTGDVTSIDRSRISDHTLMDDDNEVASRLDLLSDLEYDFDNNDNGDVMMDEEDDIVKPAKLFIDLVSSDDDM